MNKNLFINIITALQEQYDDDLTKAYLMGKVLDIEANPYDNSKLSNAIFKLLRLYFKDKTSDIEIFCWEQNFGRMNNVSIEKLWDFLQEPTRMKNNWDDWENDATYSKKDLEFKPTKLESYDGKRIDTSFLMDEIGHFNISGNDTWHCMKDPKDLDESFVPNNNFNGDEIKNIEVKDFVIISPLKKR